MVCSLYPGSRYDCWKNNPVHEYRCRPYLGSLMSRNRFDKILASLVFSSENRPYRDRFLCVRQLISAWNENMAAAFTPSWLVCIDESMVPWTSEYTAPGWVSLPRKPHPLGNEYHTIACAETNIIFRVEIVEGRDHPPELAVEYSELGKTPGLVLRMTKSIHGTGRVVVMDSGFGVLQGLIELLKVGLYSSAVVKKKRYWPKHIKGDSIDEHMSAQEIGSSDALVGRLDDKQFYVYATRDSRFICKLMATYGTLLPAGPEKRRQTGEGRLVTFRYNTVTSNYYKARGAVDTHNNVRQGSMSFEAAFASKDWANRQFAYLIASSEINALLAYNRYVRKPVGLGSLSVMEFREILAKQLIYNHDLDVQPEGIASEDSPSSAVVKRRRCAAQHQLVRPPNKTGSWHGSWKSVATDYLQRRCSGENCTERVRKYCVCDKTRFWCTNCFAVHFAEESEQSP